MTPQDPPYRLEDIDAVYAAADESRDHIAKWMGWMTPDYTRKDAERWVEHAVASWESGLSYEHLIIDAENGSIFGSCGLNHLNRVNGVCNLGYWVRASRLGEWGGASGSAVVAGFRIRNRGAEPVGDRGGGGKSL